MGWGVGGQEWGCGLGGWGEEWGWGVRGEEWGMVSGGGDRVWVFLKSVLILFLYICVIS